MNATEEGLLHAIASDPDDDTPRLVYSDWLDDHGHPERAEFIRAQIELANDTADSPRRREVAYRARQLLDAHEAEWTAVLDGAADEWVFRRGFIESIQLEVGDASLLPRTQLFELLPLRKLTLRELDGVESLADLPATNGLVALDLTGNDLDNNAVRKLLALPNLPRLRTLSLQFNALNDRVIGAMRNSPLVARLETLRLGANEFTDGGRRLLQHHLGARVSFECVRDDDRLYTFQDEQPFVTGFVSDHRQMLLWWIEDHIAAAFFDHAGNYLTIERRYIGTVNAANSQVEWEWLAELRHVPAPIRVRRFFTEDSVGINDFPWWQGEFHSPDPLNDYPELLRIWLADGVFEWNDTDDPLYLDRDGRLTDGGGPATT